MNIKKEEGLSEEEIIEILKQKSRDNSRTPVQWNAEMNSWFYNRYTMDFSG